MASEELKILLRNLNPAYEIYADVLHSGGFRDKEELATAVRADLVQPPFNIPIGAAGRIVESVKGQQQPGPSTAELLDVPLPPSKKPCLDSIQRLLHGLGRVASASTLASRPEKVLVFRQLLQEQRLGLLDHRPHYFRGTPLELLSSSFSRFKVDMAECEPSDADCKMVQSLMDIVSEVCKNERDDIQEHLAPYDPLAKGDAGAIRRWLESDYTDIQIKASKQGEGAVDVSISEEDAEICRLFTEIKTDCGGNSRIQALKYYSDAVAMYGSTDSGGSLVEAFCMPAFCIEINSATLRVSGMARTPDNLMSEAFTPCLSLFGSDSPRHVLAVARVLCALRLSLANLAEEWREARSALGSKVWMAHWPLAIRDMFSERLMSESGFVVENIDRLVFGAGVNGAKTTIVKFWQAREGQQCDVIQGLWAAAGVAPGVDQAKDAGAQWRVTVMGGLMEEEGWFSLKKLAPSTAERKAGPKELEQRVVSPEEWGAVGRAALAALDRGHACTLDEEPTVHGDPRLENMFGQRSPEGVWVVKFVDFGWSGVAGKDRYPVLISPKITWPPGVVRNGIMLQTHDAQLLRLELKSGNSREMDIEW